MVVFRDIGDSGSNIYLHICVVLCTGRCVDTAVATATPPRTVNVFLLRLHTNISLDAITR